MSKRFFLNGIEFYLSNGKYYEDNGTTRIVISEEHYNSQLVKRLELEKYALSA